MYLRNQWYCAALAKEIGAAPLGRVFLGEPVVMFRTPDGTIVALEDRCCHRRAPLSLGKVEGDKLRCGYHGFLYDATGACVWVPGQDRVPPDARVKSYPIIDKHGYVWIWMGDPALADPAKAPDFFWNDDPAWAAWSGYLPIKCHYMLLVDNLMDLSHVPVLHAGILGAAEDTQPELVWERGTGWVRGTRVARNLPPPMRWRMEGIDHNIDQTKIMTYTPPANVVISITTNEAGRKPGAPARVNQTFVVLDSMTPETETSCHYFFGSSRNYAIDNAEMTKLVEQQTLLAFDQDKEMLEAEQRIIDLDAAAPQVDVIGDGGGLQSRRLLDVLLAEERNLRAAAE
jgi:phenylpropionate dioxygenase-like ring-hydroxylating dioxygenase large terminal subunit